MVMRIAYYRQLLFVDIQNHIFREQESTKDKPLFTPKVSFKHFVSCDISCDMTLYNYVGV